MLVAGRAENIAQLIGGAAGIDVGGSHPSCRRASQSATVKASFLPSHDTIGQR
jgi:hypothetical protein